ncbi:MAG: phage replisome organizer N-terminal domain-containing protein [Clostridia bacterium]|nr:phage replisome organizer N-terminal domain-containing protein [Clostridia bacterium]
MSTEKKFFWLKLKENFFDDKQIKYLRSLPDGDKVVITYLKMQLKSLKTDGILKYDKLLPTCEEELALMLDEDINIVKLTIQALLQLNSIEILEDNTIFMIATQELIGKEGSSAERMRQLRKKQKQLLSQCDKNVQLCSNRVALHSPESEIESESDQEKEKEIEKKSEKESEREITINDIMNAYEQNIGKMEMPIFTEMTLMLQQHQITKEDLYNAIIKAGKFGGKTWKYVCTVLVNRNE